MLFNHFVRVVRSGAVRTPLRRTLFIDTLSNVYLDLAIALPYPPTWPIYSSTVILVGVASRVALLPVVAWARMRERRAEEIVIPYLKAYRAKLEEQARKQLRKEDSDAARDYFSRTVSKKLRVKQDELFKHHSCTPWITMLVPSITQLPVFVLLSATFYHAANVPGSVLRDEPFLTLQSLVHPDPTATLPIILGLVSLATIETSGWFATQERARRLAQIQRTELAQRAKGKIVIQPMRYMKSILRGLSVGRILLATMAPGVIEIYWVTSAILGLFTNWTMNYSDYHREMARNAQPLNMPRQLDKPSLNNRNLRSY